MGRMKIAYMLEKDLLVFFRDYKSFLLLFIAPLFIASSIGLVYINSTPSDIPLVVCTTGEKNDIYYKMEAQIIDAGMFKVTEVEGNCTEEIGRRIKTSEARLGVIINSNATMLTNYTNYSYYNTTTEVIYDNSKPISFFIQSQISMLSSQLSKQMINNAVGIAHDEMATTVREVDNYLNKTSGYIDQMKSLRLELSRIKEVITSTKEKMQAVDAALSNIDSYVQSMDYAISDFDNLQSQIQDANQSVAIALATLDSVNITLPEKEELRNELYPLAEKLSSMKAQIMTIRNEFVRSRNYVSGLRNQVKMDSALDSITFAESRLTTAISEMDDVIYLSEKSMGEIRSIKTYLQNRMNAIPSDFEEPMQTKMTGYFGNRNFINFMFPTIIVTIMMWISVFLSSVAFIKQRNQGILKRMSLSPTGSGTIILEKILLYTVISLMFLPFIFLLGIFAFGVEISIFSVLPIIIIYAVTSALFVLQGLTIGCFANSENSATLAAIMLVVPLMFLSGTFFPQESLPSLVKFFTPFMPINISVNLMEGFFFYEFTLGYLLLNFGKLILYLLVFTGIAWLFLSRTIKK